uniref:Uncharacterized protein n=1 Tax=Rhizophora mucronata TaxID=61149 RepID=A0A2P2PHG9_RHIMU
MDFCLSLSRVCLVDERKSRKGFAKMGG